MTKLRNSGLVLMGFVGSQISFGQLYDPMARFVNLNNPHGQLSAVGSQVVRSGDTIDVDQQYGRHSLVLSLNATLEGSGRIATGHVELIKAGKVQRTVRFQVFPHNTKTKILVGAPGEGIEQLVVHFDDSDNGVSKIQTAGTLLEYFENSRLSMGEVAKITKVSVKDRTPIQQQILDSIALKHAPFISTRSDLLLKRRIDDVPLVLGYSFLPQKGGFSIKYNVVFSDQDAGKTTVEALDQQVAHWHRLSDIEWVYEIYFTHEGKKSDEQILWHVAFNYAESAAFKGQRLGDHPIVYVNSTHNSFSDSPSGDQAGPGAGDKFEGYHFVPQEIPFPESREHLIFANPWTFKVTFDEIKERGIEVPAPEDMLIIKVNGWNHGKGVWTPKVTVTNPETGSVGEYFLGLLPNKSKTVSNLGTHLWNRSGYFQVALPKSVKDAIFNKSAEIKVVLNDIAESNKNTSGFTRPHGNQASGLSINSQEDFKLMFLQKVTDQEGAYTLQDISSMFEYTIRNSPQWSEAVLKRN
jgi:hypothetical protein